MLPRHLTRMTLWIRRLLSRQPENYCLYRQRAQLRIAADEELFRLERLILSGFHGNAEYQRRLKRLKRINRKVRRLEVRIRIHEELLGLSRAIQR